MSEAKEKKEELPIGRQIAANDVKIAREESTLPGWCLKAISSTAYDEAHHSGLTEIDILELSMIKEFERSMECHKEKSE